jgi:hypothetical protein
MEIIGKEVEKLFFLDPVDDRSANFINDITANDMVKIVEGGDGKTTIYFARPLREDKTPDTFVAGNVFGVAVVLKSFNMSSERCKEFLDTLADQLGFRIETHDDKLDHGSTFFTFEQAG